MKNILFIYAHIDDETINSYGFIQKMIDSNVQVTISIMCGASNDNCQQKVLFNLFKDQNVHIHLGSYVNVSILRSDAKNFATDQILGHQYDMIVSHSVNDVHYEHRLLAEEVLIASRTKKSMPTKCLLSTQTSIGQWTYGQFGYFQPNLFIDISKYAKNKEEALRQYENIDLIPSEENDLRSSSSIMNYNRNLGSIVNVDYAEGYQQVFCIK